MSTTPYIAAHLRALGSTAFDLGVLLPTDTMIPRRNWTAAQVARALPWLRAQNFQGAQIFIRPSLDQINAILVDDIPKPQLERLTLEPAAILETSPGNCQVWIRLAQTVSIPHARALARHLQQLWHGDPGSADGQHFGRLAGFTNRWPRHQQSDGSYPLVRLLTTQRVLYEPAAIGPGVPEPAAAPPRAARRRPNAPCVGSGRWRNFGPIPAMAGIITGRIWRGPRRPCAPAGPRRGSPSTSHRPAISPRKDRSLDRTPMCGGRSRRRSTWCNRAHNPYFRHRDEEVCLSLCNLSSGLSAPFLVRICRRTGLRRVGRSRDRRPAGPTREGAGRRGLALVPARMVDGQLFVPTVTQHGRYYEALRPYHALPGKD